MPVSSAKDLVAKSVPKIKKVPSGPIREKARSMDKLIASVGKVLQKKGYAGLKIANIAAEANLDKKLIYLYFGSLDNLVDTFMLQRDFWNIAEKGVIDNLLGHVESLGKDDIISLLHSQSEKLYKDSLLRKVLHWELGEKTPALRKIARTREELDEPIWAALDKDFKKSKADPRAVLALQMAGINYLVMQAKTSGTPFCGLDLNKAEDKARINAAVAHVVNDLYDGADLKPKAAVGKKK